MTGQQIDDALDWMWQVEKINDSIEEIHMLMTTTHDDELEKILDECTTEEWVSWDGEEEHAIDSFDKEKAKKLLIERDKARELAARKESAQRLQQKITRYGDGEIAYHNGEATVSMSAVLEELVGLKSQQQENE